MDKRLGETRVKTGALKRIFINIGAVSLLIMMLLLVIRINTNKEEMISVVRVKNEIYPNQLITKDNLDKYDMVRREYDNAGTKFLLWSEVDECDNKYSSVYVRKNGYIVKGDYLDYKPIKNPWMHEADNSELFVMLKYDRSDAFGNILTPGDRVKVNISYNMSETQQDDMFAGVSSKTKVETLFEDIMIIDLMNSRGNSIYDYYTDILNLPLAEREKLLRDETFLSDVSPVSMILKIEKDSEFYQYSKVKNLQGIKYTIGLHPRKEGDIIIDQFKDITRQITQNQTQINNQGDERK